MLSNQLKRQDDEIKALVAKTEASERLDKEHQAKIKEHERKYADLEAKVCYQIVQTIHLIPYAI